ncbi:ras-associating and dilute domain-containing protein isoform 2-T2 [Menidia menidia]
MALSAAPRPSRSVLARKGSMMVVDPLQADDPFELSNQITAPGILKIFGNEICEGAHYKSVLATTLSSAKELVKEALERYGLSKEEAESYVLCDTIGSISNHQWSTEGFRVVGDHEKPLLLQSLWKPREGLARRFEIQRRSLVEEKTSKEKDTVTAGINAQARKLQKSRSRVTSTLVERSAGRGQKLWRSKSEMDLLDAEPQSDPGQQEGAGGRREQQPSPEQNRIHGPGGLPEGGGGPGAHTETLCVSRPRGEREGEESEREETESSDDNSTQYSIHPPHDCPYLLLLQGCSLTQDFVIYLLAAPHIVVGQKNRTGEGGEEADVLLSAADLLPKHCSFHRPAAGAPVLLCPWEGAAVTRNGQLLRTSVQLAPGDVIGLGQHYLFLFKDPSALTHKDVGGVAPGPGPGPWTLGDGVTMATASLAADALLCDSCVSNRRSSGWEGQRRGAPPALTSPEGRPLTLDFAAEDGGRVVREAVAMGGGGGGGPALTAAVLLCACVQHAAAHHHTPELRRLLLQVAGGVQSAVWEHTKNLAAAQPEVLSGEVSVPEELQVLSLQELMSGLHPLVVWMSNSLEMLQFIQHQLPVVLEWRHRAERGREEEWADSDSKEMENLVLLELCLSSVRSASEETMAVLEEVIMLAFQQCVYYITKFLYPVLPGLLDCDPFRESDGAPGGGGGGELRVPGEIRQVVEVLDESWTLLSDCQVHPEISAQLLGYLFYFINASLFNSLMERGSEPGFYQWARGVRLRANLDLLLDWAHAAGLGEVALEHTHTLSSAINLLATPRKHLIQTSWASLRSSYSSLSAAQLNHLLSSYTPPSACRHTWAPAPPDRAAAHHTADVLESFDTHHPLMLPDGGYQLLLRTPLTDPALSPPLHSLREFILSLSHPPANATQHQDPCGDAHLLSLKLLKLQTGEGGAGQLDRSDPDHASLLTPPNSPLLTGAPPRGGAEPDPWSTAAGPHGGAGLVLECLAALRSENLRSENLRSEPGGAPPLGELQEEEEEEQEDEEEAEYHNDEVFSLELERGEGGLGLALLDTRDTPLKVKGIFVRGVVPDSPAARCERLEPGDRILAVNGVSLLGLDYQRGRELIQSSAGPLRLLVARSAALQTEC